MKLLLSLVFFIPLLVLAQSDNERIADIKKWYQEVESKLDHCIKIPLTVFYDENYVSGGSTDMEGYYDTINKEFIKIVEHTYYDWSEDETSYYYNKGELFFIFSAGYTPGDMFSADELGLPEDSLWLNGGEAKNLNHYEKRYYFQGDKCIKYLRKNDKIDIDEDPNLSAVENKEQSPKEKGILTLHLHGRKLYLKFTSQLNPKKK